MFLDPLRLNPAVSLYKAYTENQLTLPKFLDLLWCIPFIGWIIYYIVCKSLQNRVQSKAPISKETQKADALALATKELPRFQKTLETIRKKPPDITAEAMFKFSTAVRDTRFKINRPFNPDDNTSEARRQLNRTLDELSNILKEYTFDERNQLWLRQTSM